MGYSSVGPVGDSGSSISDTHTSRRTHPSPCRLHRQPTVPVTTQRLEEQNHSLEDVSNPPRNGSILSAAFLVHLPTTPSAPPQSQPPCCMVSGELWLSPSPGSLSATCPLQASRRQARRAGGGPWPSLHLNPHSPSFSGHTPTPPLQEDLPSTGQAAWGHRSDCSFSESKVLRHGLVQNTETLKTNVNRPL